MPETIRIGNAQGFWGDRLEAASEMLALEPELDYLTLDFLAEVSMSIMAASRRRDRSAGYAPDFLEIVGSIVPYWSRDGQCRIVSNAGGLNPMGCALACREILQRAGCGDRRIAVVSGDDVLGILCDDAASNLHSPLSRNLDTQRPIEDVIESMMTANAYLGARPIAEALDLGADLVITGRIADPSLTVGPCLHHFDWSDTDYDRIAGATVAGHLIECGTQVTGGISTDWMAVPHVNQIGFPIVEITENGNCIVTKPRHSGGWVTEATVKEQLLYEIGDPGRYLSPDATVSFLSIRVTQQGRDRVAVEGAEGDPPPDSYKVSATFSNGFRSASQLTILGGGAKKKACRAADMVLDQLKRGGITFENHSVETTGSDDEVTLRIAVSDPLRKSVEKFTRAVIPLVTSGPPGTTGYSEGRPRIHPLVEYWPCLVDRDRVIAKVDLLPLEHSQAEMNAAAPPLATETGSLPAPTSSPHSEGKKGMLADIALARSGDKGIHANIGVIARRPGDYSTLVAEVTPVRVAEHLGVDVSDVRRFELPNLGAVNLVIHGILANPLRLDAQGKTLGQELLKLPLGRDNESRC